MLPIDERFRLAPEHAAQPRSTPTSRRAPAAVRRRGAGRRDEHRLGRPAAELAEICRERGAWLHVDAAYGGFAALADRRPLAGLEHADSVTLDPHKWLYQPYECGCLLVRDGQVLRRRVRDRARTTCAMPRADEDEVNFSDLGLQLTRSARALKIWVSLRYFGLGAFREAIALARLGPQRRGARGERHARAAGAAVARHRLLPPRRPRRGRATPGSSSALERSGTGLISTTRLHGRFALRMCVLNHQSTPEDVEAVLAFLETAEPQAPEPARERHPDDRQRLAWVAAGRPAVAARAAALRRPRARTGGAGRGTASLREFAAGEKVIEQWDLGAELFVIVEGTATVTVDGQQARELGRGDFFGELAGARVGRRLCVPRDRVGQATSPLRLLVFPEGVAARARRALSRRSTARSARRSRRAAAAPP